MIIFVLVIIACYSNKYFVAANNIQSLEYPIIRDGPKLIQDRIGNNVTLWCELTNDNEFMTNTQIYWEYLPCGEGYKETPCYTATNDRYYEQTANAWRQIDCNDRVVSCKKKLTIINSIEEDSGLYRCNVHPNQSSNRTSLQIQIVTYQLDIINSTISSPEFMGETPANSTVVLDGQAVFQCRVHSRNRPIIKWFKRRDLDYHLPDHIGNNFSNAIEYSQNIYALMASAGDKGLTEDTYLSKLILNNVTERDSGFYVCVAMNYRGYILREAYLHVLAPNDEPSNKIEFLLLFLMPVGLALIPLIIWTCYIVIRARSFSKNDHIKICNNNYVIINQVQRV